MKPGEYFLAEGDIIANNDEKTVTIKVSNSGDRPVQVGSHFHFCESNRALKFDRQATLGMRLNIPSGTAVRFEPGQTHEVELTAITGSGIIHGFNALVEGSLNDKKVKEQALKRVQTFADEK